MQHRWIKMFEMQMDMILMRPNATTLTDFNRAGARHYIARGQILG